MARIDDAISRSNRAVLSVVWPRIGPMCGGGELRPVTDERDKSAGIDFLWFKHGTQYGMAARVQWCHESYDTFSVRTLTGYSRSRETERAKRQRARQFDAMNPDYTLHGYVTKDGSRLLGAAVCSTDALYDLVEGGPPRHEYVNPADRSQFVAGGWREFDPDRIWIWRPSQQLALEAAS